MNAGAHGSDMSEILVKARILFEDGTIEWLTNEEMGFSYRTSVLQKKRPGVCLEAVLQLEQKEREAITAQMRAEQRLQKKYATVFKPMRREHIQKSGRRIMPETSLKKRD